jgi:hypothetical protein
LAKVFGIERHASSYSQTAEKGMLAAGKPAYPADFTGK